MRTTAATTLWIFLLSVSTLASAADGDAPAGENKEGQPATEVAPGDDSRAMPAYGETMVVTGSRTEEAIIDAPVAMSVITPEKLERSPADNYADLLRGIPGLNVIQSSARDLSFTARGATSTLATSQLALLDGRSIYQDFYGFVMWDLLPVSLEEVEQIEVQRGPGSAIWGANAMSGVINVRTKTPRQLAGGSAAFSLGEVGTYAGSARWAAAGEKWSYKVAGGYSEQDAWERDPNLPSGDPLPPSARFENEGTKQPKLDLRVDYEPGDDQLWSFEAGFSRTAGIIHTGIGPFTIDDKSKMGFGKVAYRRGSFDGLLYLNRIDADSKNLLNGLDFAFANTTLALELTNRQAIGDRHALVYGASARTNNFDLEIAPRGDSRQELGAFLEDRISFNGKVLLNLGARVDWFDTIGTTLSPRTSIVVKPHPDHSLRFAYNRAFRSPSLVNNYLDTRIFNAVDLAPGLTFVFPTFAVGNEDLKEEVVDAFEVGYTANLSDGVTASVALYRNRTQDNIDFYPASFYGPTDPPPGWPFPPAAVPAFRFPKSYSYRNVGEVVDRGIELSADIRISPAVSASLSYTYQDEPEVTDDSGSPIPLELGTPPENQFAIGLNAAQGIWFGSVGLTYTGSALWTDVLDQRFWGETDSYTLVNAALGVKLAGRYTFSVKANNLTDQEVKQHVFGDIIRRRVVGEVRASF